MIRSIFYGFFSVALVCFANAAPYDNSAASGAVGDDVKWDALLQGDVVLLSSCSDGEGDEPLVVAAVVIDAPVRAVWDVIDDKEKTPEFIDGLKAAKVVEDAGPFQLIEQEMKISALLPSFVYVVRHTPTPYRRVDFKRESGDLKDIVGYWKFIPVDDGKRTLLIYSLDIDPGMLVPGVVVRQSLKKTLPEALLSIRDRVYRLGAS